MEALQIYGIVNEITAEALGSSAITATETQGLIALGNIILDSSTHTESFINTLVRRIGKTVVSHRAYTNQFSDLVKDNFEFGAILQKIKVDMPQAEEDESFDLVDDGTVDHYKIKKPVAHQKLFMTETPYQVKITIQRVHLKEAFTSEQAMGSFIGAIYGEVQNALEVAIENLGRTCLSNYVAEISTVPTRFVNLRTNYNAIKGASLTADQCLYDPDFLRYAIATIKNYSKKMTSMSTIFNDGTTSRHTPYNMQNLFVLSDFELQLETVIQYSAFNKNFVELSGYKEVAFWQSIKEPYKISITRASDNQQVDVSYLLCVLGDKDACGTYQRESWTATTPFNAAGGYANTYWHEKQLWYTDLSENMVAFVID